MEQGLHAEKEKTPQPQNQSHTLRHRPQKTLFKQDNTKSLLECNSTEKETRSRVNV